MFDPELAKGAAEMGGSFELWRWGAVFAALIAGTTFAYNIGVGLCRQKNDKRRLRDAIYIEIKHHVKELDDSIKESFKEEDLDEIVALIETVKGRTLFVVYARSIHMFDELRKEISVLRPSTLEPVLGFYNHLETLFAFAESFERPSFQHATAGGKKKQITYWIEEMQKASKVGKEALRAFEEDYSEIRLMLGKPEDQTVQGLIPRTIVTSYRRKVHPWLKKAFLCD